MQYTIQRRRFVRDLGMLLPRYFICVDDHFDSAHSTDWALVMAFITITIIPAIIFYLFAERYLIAGLTAEAVKG